MDCKNCKATFDDSLNYCPHCGAKVIRNRLTIRNLGADINEQFLSIDNKFLKTLIHLLTKPEEVINGYITGTRKKYVGVIQFFAISLTFVGIQVFLMNTFFKDAMEMDPNMLGPLGDPELQKNNPMKDLKYEDVNNYQSLIYVLTIPFSAISTYLAYWITGERRYNFTEHTVLNLYYSAEVIILNAFVVIAMLMCGIDFLYVSLIPSIFVFIYIFYILKRVFNSTFIETLAHFLLMLVVLIVVLTAIMILIFVVGYFIGYFAKRLGII